MIALSLYISLMIAKYAERIFKMKYRDYQRSKSNAILYGTIVMLFLLYIRTFSAKDYHQFRRNYHMRNGKTVVVPWHIFQGEPPERDGLVRQSESAFSKINNFDSMALQDKLARWESEYDYRSSEFHLESKERIVQILTMNAPYDAVFVDSGAHVGDTGLPILQKVHSMGRTDINLVLIEPDESKCLWLKRKINDIEMEHPGFADRVTVVNSGLWSHETSASLIRDQSHPGAWTVKTDEYGLREHMKKKGAIESDFQRGPIPLLSIGDILDPDADFFFWHLDVEDTEYRAMLGLMRTNFRPYVLFENHSVGKDFLMAPDIMRYVLGYRLIERLGEFSDRLMVPNHLWDPLRMKDMPSYI